MREPMQDPEVAAALKEVLTDAVKILGPALIAAVVAVRVARSHLRVERLKIHDMERALAHKRLFAFAKRLEARTFPMAERKEQAFNRLMEEEYLDKLQLDLIYFSDRVFEILDRFEDHFTCMNSGECGMTQTGRSSSTIRSSRMHENWRRSPAPRPVSCGLGDRPPLGHGRVAGKVRLNVVGIKVVVPFPPPLGHLREAERR